MLINKNKQEEKQDIINILSRLLSKEIKEKTLENNPDIHNLYTEKDSIGIEEIKNLQKQMIYKPFQEQIQIGIIYDAEKLTTQAQNALLKSLEDSTKYSTYILHVDNEKNLLPTIRSRSKIIYVKNQEKEQQPNNIDEDILEKTLLEKFQTIEQYTETKQKSNELINGIENILKTKLELQIKNGNINNSKKILEQLKIITDCRAKISANCNKKLALESMLIQLEP